MSVNSQAKLTIDNTNKSKLVKIFGSLALFFICFLTVGCDRF